MADKRSYLRRRLQWTNHSTVARPYAPPGRRLIVIVEPVVLALLGFVSRELIAVFSPDLLPEWIRWIDERIARGVSPVALPVLWLITFWAINWMRAPGRLDRQSQDEIVLLRSRVSELERRRRPDIWITPEIREGFLRNSANQIIPIHAGFSIRNASDRDLERVQAELIDLKNFHETTINGEDFADFVQYPAFHSPVVLEWSPQEQNKSGLSETRIPGGTSRWVGLFGNPQNPSLGTVLAANHDVRGSLLLVPGQYRFAIRLSAAGVPAVEKSGYEVDIDWSDLGQCIRFTFNDDEPSQLVDAGTEESAS